MSEKNEVTRSSEALTRAFAAHLRSGAELLMAWKAGLSSERAAKLQELEAQGLRLGISLTMPADRWVAQLWLLDAAGETVVLDTIEQAGAMPSIN